MTSTLRAAIAAVALAIAAPAALAQGSTEKGIEAYRQALQDGNPAELWEASGEDLWKKRTGPKNASLEKCDLGLGPGVVKGAYAQMPPHFADADRVMDLETRLVWWRVNLQGMSEADAKRGPFGGPDRKSDIEALVAWITLQQDLPPGGAEPGKALPPKTPCVESRGLSETQRAAFHYHANLVTRRAEVHGPTDCPYLLVQSSTRDPAIEPAGAWRRVWEGGRPRDRERYRLYRRG